MRTTHVLVAAWLTLGAMGLHAAPPPAWVAGQGVDAASYPTATHLTGFGLSSSGGDEAKLRREAVAMAREDLASRIRTHINSEFVKRTTLQDKAMASFARSVVKTKSSLELEGLDRFDYFFDARKGTYYCLAILDRAWMSRHLRDTIAQRSRECADLFARAKAARDVPGLLKVSRLIRKLEENLVVYRVISGDYPANLAYPAITEVGQEIRKNYAAEKGLDGYLGSAVFDLGVNLPEGIRVLVDRIHYADTRFSGTLSAYVEQAVSEKLVSMGNIQLIDKASLKDVLGAMGPDANPAEALHSQAVIHGTYFDLGSDVKLNLRATSAEGDELASTSIRIPSLEVTKAKLNLLPENYLEAKKALEIYDAKVQGSKLQIRLAADRGDGGLYRKGDRLYLFLKANLDCYVKIIYHQVDGTKILIFPNNFHPDSRIEKDRLYQIPPSGTAFSFEVVEPFGIEMVKVFAATTPIDLNIGEKTPEGFSILKESLADLAGRTRGIAVKKGETMYAEDTVVINTLNRLP